MQNQPRSDGFSRRSFLRGAGGVAAGGVVGQALAEAGQAPADPDVRRLSGEVELELTINGSARRVKVEPRTTLLSVLRERLDPPLTGAKLVCDHGSCGACTVHVDGRAVMACMQLAVALEGRAITTIEGLAPEGELTPLQESFCAHDGLMCGFCTPGFVMALEPVLAANPAAGDAELIEACSGNVCRCGTYPQIQIAARAAGRRMGGANGANGAPGRAGGGR